VLEVAWIKAFGFPRKVRKYKIIKEILHLDGDPIEVDEDSLKVGKVIRVKVFYKDATKVEGCTVVYINGQGYLIRWWNEKGEKG
jgi:hypothetical protein